MTESATGTTIRLPRITELPEFLAPHLAERNAGDPEQFPYQIKSSLHFSNGGGVYLGTDKRTGRRVVGVRVLQAAQQLQVFLVRRAIFDRARTVADKLGIGLFAKHDDRDIGLAAVFAVGAKRGASAGGLL